MIFAIEKGCISWKPQDMGEFSSSFAGTKNPQISASLQANDQGGNNAAAAPVFGNPGFRNLPWLIALKILKFQSKFGSLFYQGAPRINHVSILKKDVTQRPAMALPTIDAFLM